MLALIEKQEFVIAGFLNWGSLDIRGSVDSLKYQRLCRQPEIIDCKPRDYACCIFLEDPKILFVRFLDFLMEPLTQEK